MTDPRFYCPSSLPTGETIELPDEISHHIRVLRLPADAEITLFNGHGGQVSARLTFDGKTALAKLLRHDPREAELAGDLTLWQGLAAGDKMDWVVEKCVELGVTRLIPIAAQRSVLQLSGARLEKRVLHWRKIAQAASEQTGRNRLMQVDAPLTLPQALSQEKKQAQRLFCDPQANLSLRDHLMKHPSATAIDLLVGPEGGWAETETKAALAHGATAVQYGSRILRTETAGIALAAAITAIKDW